MEERKTIYLCLAHMSETGEEQKYVKEAFALSYSGHEEQTGIGTTQGRFYRLFPMQGSVSMLGCFQAARTAYLFVFHSVT